MTTVAVLADPPRPGRVLGGLVDDGPIGPDAAADLYGALLRDACVAVERSGGDLLVNYRSPDDLDDEAARAAVESVVAPALADPDAARYEVQVGSSRSARVGNTVAHLLETEGVRSAAALDPRVTLLERRHLDGAAMKLRQSPVVLGPAADGRLWYAAFTEPIDFTEVFSPPALRTVTERARSDDLAVDFLETLPVVERPADLGGALVHVTARERADRPVPRYASETVRDLGLAARPTADGLSVHSE